MATRAGVCQAVFPEGGLSRDGTMREAKLGFSDYMLRDYHPQSDREIVFIPVGINSRRDRWRRFGYASVNFGKPVSARKWCQSRDVEFTRLEQEPRFVEVGRLANALMERIADVVPVLPVPLPASVVPEHRDDWQSPLAIKSCALERIGQLRQQGAPIRIAAGACEGVLSNALTTLCARKMLEQRDGLLRAAADAEHVLSHYVNSINRWCLPGDPADRC